jgi:uncharacterized protein (DUF2141 family)
MRINSLLKPVLFSVLLLPSTLWAEKPSLKVIVTGLEPSVGTVELSLFSSEESFMTEPLSQKNGRPDENGEFIWNMVVLTEGEYAVVVVHDANDNGKLDRGFLGIGGESYGFSNNVRPWFGWPDFSDAAVTIESADVEMVIQLD